MQKKPLPKSRFKFCFEQSHAYNTAVWVGVQHIRTAIRNCSNQQCLLVATAYSIALYAIHLPHAAVYFLRWIALSRFWIWRRLWVWQKNGLWLILTHQKSTEIFFWYITTPLWQYGGANGFFAYIRIIIYKQWKTIALY